VPPVEHGVQAAETDQGIQALHLHKDVRTINLAALMAMDNPRVNQQEAVKHNGVLVAQPKMHS
jgi:hypothetical protein